MTSVTCRHRMTPDIEPLLYTKTSHFLRCIRIPWGPCSNAESDSVGLGWRFCLSEKLPDDVGWCSQALTWGSSLHTARLLSHLIGQSLGGSRDLQSPSSSQRGHPPSSVPSLRLVLHILSWRGKGQTGSKLTRRHNATIAMPPTSHRKPWAGSGCRGPK